MPAAVLAAYACLKSKGAYRIRLTRLTAGGVMDPGAGNSIVSSSIMRVNSAPQVVTGAVTQQRTGSGALCVDLKDPDTVNRAAMQATICTQDPEVTEMMAGGTLVKQGGTTVGYQDRFGETAPLPVLLEAWAMAISEGGANQATDDDGNPLWFHYIFPWTVWTPGEYALEEGVIALQLTGDALPNPNAALGPAADWPAAVTSYRAYYLDTTVPAATCGAQTLTLLGSA